MLSRSFECRPRETPSPATATSAGRPITIAIAAGSLSAGATTRLELNAEMVWLGWALAYRPGDDPFPQPEYEPQEAAARAAGRGMWRGTFMAPWDWRHR